MGLKNLLAKIGKGALSGGRVAALFDPTGTAGRVLGALEGAGVITSPEAKGKAREILLQHETKMAEMETQRVAEINKTMQAELQFGNSWQRGWRPMLGYTLAVMIVNNYVLSTWFELNQIVVPEKVWLILGAAVGIGVWSRGREKEARIKNGGTT
ncbi:hypothetical protein LCGC14_1572030 [marine sediment metagenome]|uniref:Holin of 3TMs, for gene-transfer release n=1 Tax=marine sediment metagenome TaxID=412755 RepID=A0A0F9IJJ7_9ZZZZ